MPMGYDVVIWGGRVVLGYRCPGVSQCDVDCHGPSLATCRDRRHPRTQSELAELYSTNPRPHIFCIFRVVGIDRVFAFFKMSSPFYTVV